MDNLENLYRQCSKDDLKNKNWYVNANLYIGDMSMFFDIPIEKTAGIVSALSPACPWKQNIIDAYNFIKARGKYKPVTYSSQVRKALRILKLRKDRLGQIHSILNGPKTKCFYHALLRPYGTTPPVIDTHMIKAFLGLPNADNRDKRVRYYAKEKNQSVIQGAIINLAIDLGIHHHALQAILWSAFKRITDNKVYSNVMPSFTYLIEAPKRQDAFAF